MIRAACHCTAVRFEITEAPSWVLDCNCTICRRYGVLWSYYHGEDQAKLVRSPDEDASASYIWGDRGIAFRHCKTCGCMTHMQTLDVDPPVIFGINARMMVGLDPATVQVRQYDNGHTGYFWTKSAAPVTASRYPPTPPRDENDWR